MQSISSFLSRNNFNAQIVDSLIEELGINIISAGSTKMLTKADAEELRRTYLSRTAQES